MRVAAIRVLVLQAGDLISSITPARSESYGDDPRVQIARGWLKPMRA